MHAATHFDPVDRTQGPPVASAARQNGSLLDDPNEWSAFSRPLDGDPSTGLWESQVLVEGIHCAACAFTIEAALAQAPGVEKAEVNAATRRARVVWSSARIKPSVWFEACANAGYRLVPAGDTFMRARREREARLALWRWLVAGLCMMQVMMYAYPAYVALPGDMSADAAQLLRWASWVLTLPVILFSCGPFFRSALRDLRMRVVGMDLPVALGIAITFVVSTAATFDPQGPLGEEVYFDSLTMFVFFLLTGRWLESRLRDRTAGALEALMNHLPESCERRMPGGGFERVAVRRLVRGDVVRVLPGESFPGDGIVLSGDTSADEALLTGESRPVARGCGAQVLAGSHNLSAAVEVLIKSTGQDTRYARIVELMESASLSRPRLARLADRVARPFLLAVLATAALSAALLWPIDHGKALMVAVSVLIVTCPCALSLATPAATLASAGWLARHGVVVRKLQAFESLAGIDTVIFDKTGTLTRATPRLDRIYCRQGMRPRDALERAAAMAAQSLHPAARSLSQAWSAAFSSPPAWVVMQLAEFGGQGLEARLALRTHQDGHPLPMRLGSAAHCGVPALEVDATQVHLSDDAGWVASFVLVEELRADAAAAVAALVAQGLAVHLLSGDQAASARTVAQQAGIRQVKGDCTPEEKLLILSALQRQGHRVAMVGDGLNDGPALARADASFAFGEAVPLTQAHSDFIVTGASLDTIPSAIHQARCTLRVVRQNLWWAASYNALCIPLAIAGWVPAWLAGIGMAASSLAVVLNAARLTGQRKAAS
ncbi:cation-translocating P-type ATPase [Variovorax sp. J22R133]|uniref:heavy metal translocating P-type ATPase n=1 Tax=Variovorax brevis TaxID=3053503 RepID=UPI002575DCE8|nr:cation-translocating P-type ATPase [Variovorax sp. J22R133]MDM0117698.1 cation-translocating P-type ATPase [Variovorax sp. J22R133]